MAQAVPRDKVLDLDTLALRIAQIKSEGRRVVLCHGVFDLLHLGHMRHFEEAKSFGDVLVVTVTEDAFVNKGPNRPAFSQNLRAEAIAGLALVDYVAVNRWPNAVETLRLLQPDIYVKGPDYRVSSDDVTSGITKEEEAILSVGGRLVFTQGETFSSSNLLNQYLPSYPPEVEDYLKSFRQSFTPAAVRAQLDRLRTSRPVVVGEAIIDEYVYCQQMGKAAKEPVLAMRYVGREQFAGGALAVANHIASFCDEVELITFLGDRDSQEEFIRSRLADNVKVTILYKNDSPTIVKRRYVENHLTQKLFEVYDFNDELLDPDDDAAFCAVLANQIGSQDVVIASDFGHGMFTENAISVLAEQAKFLAVNTQINAANIGFHTISRYPCADLICTNENEVRLDARKRVGSLEPMVAEIARRMRCPNVMVTRSKSGATFYRHGKGFYRSPAFAGQVVDRVGSGDAVLAVAAVAVAADVPAPLIPFLANVIGAQAVQIMGNRHAIDRAATIKFIDSLLK